jgi:hypothetical protein
MEGPNFTQTSSVFSMTCRVAINIHANAERIWILLTDARGFPRWNSTVTSVDGEIGEGKRIVVRAPGTDRKFTPKVSGIVPKKSMIWTGGFAPMFKGVRTFNLSAQPDGSTDFAMEERFSGLMLPLVGRSLPDFKPIFERYASDLKNESERSAG